MIKSVCFFTLFLCLVQCRMEFYARSDETTAPSLAYDEYWMESVVNPALQYWGSTLTSANSSSSKTIVVDNSKYSYSCNNASDLPKETVTADYYFYILYYYDTSDTRMSCSICANRLISQERNQRPFLAVIKINYRLCFLPGKNLLVHERNINSFLHEMTHAFGYSYDDQFPRWFNQSSGTTYTPGWYPSLYLPNPGYSVRTVRLSSIVLPLRTYFKCSALSGAYLDYASGSHWFNRAFLLEYMQPSIQTNQLVSDYTLNLLETTGWYIADYNYAENYHFGKEQQCDFLNGSNAQAKSYREYRWLGYSNVRYCDFGKTGGGNAVTLGGGNVDGMTYTDPQWDVSCLNDNPDQSKFLAFDLQSFGQYSNSKCFEGTLGKTAASQFTTTYCFQYRCNFNGTLTVYSKTMTWLGLCSSNGQIFNVGNYVGYIQCPEITYFCQNIHTTKCSKNCISLTNGKCVDGKCQCEPDWTGRACSLKKKFASTDVSFLEDFLGQEK